MEAIQDSHASIMSMFQERMARFESELQNATASSQSQPTDANNISRLTTEFSLFKNVVIQTLSNLQHQIEILTHNVDRVEMHSRKKMLLIHGVSESRDDPAKAVVKLVQDKLKLVDFTENDIRRCHRMGRKKVSTSKNPRPIVLKLNDMSVRNNIWFAKTNLKGTGITISEFLTKLRHDMFIAARQKFGTGKCWTRDGMIHVTGSDGTHHLIKSFTDLKMVPRDTTPQDTAPQINNPIPMNTDKIAAQVPKTRRTNASKK